jgi:large subunit ribosomal protein L10
MAMTKDQKVAAVEGLVEKLGQTPTIYLTNYSGLSVEQATILRDKFREMGVEYKVVKNTLLKLAMEQLGGYEEMYDQLSGPTAVAFSEEPSSPARVIKKFLDDMKTDLPALKAASIEGAIYDENALEALARLKSKAELLGEIVGLLMSPITNIVGGLQAQGGNLVGAIKTISEREN